MPWFLKLPATPSLNKLKRQHWTAIRSLKEAWLWNIMAQATKIPKATGPRTITITRFSAGTLDYDNLVASAKEVIIDNLRPASTQVLKSGKFRQRTGVGLIVDDSPQWVSVTYRQVRISRKDEGHTLVEIADADPCTFGGSAQNDSPGLNTQNAE